MWPTGPDTLSGGRRGVRQPPDQRRWSCPMAPGRQKQRHFSPGHEGGWGAEKSARQDRGGPGFQVSPLNSSPGSRGPRGCHSLPFQPGEVGGQLSLLLVTGKQGLWGNRPELHLPPPPHPALPTRLCCRRLHSPACKRALHISVCSPSPSPPHTVTGTPPPCCLLSGGWHGRRAGRAPRCDPGPQTACRRTYRQT